MKGHPYRNGPEREPETPLWQAMALLAAVTAAVIGGSMSCVSCLSRSEREKHTAWQREALIRTVSFDNACDRVTIVSVNSMTGHDSTPDAYILDVCGVRRRYRHGDNGWFEVAGGK